MDLASLSLGQIASMLSPKQQEVLLASISVAANFIQQIQNEEQERETMMQQQQQQHQHQQQNNNSYNNLTNNSSINNINNSSQLSNYDDDDFDDDDGEELLDDDYDTDNQLTDLSLANTTNRFHNKSTDLSTDHKKATHQSVRSTHHNDTHQSNRNNNSNNGNNDSTATETDPTDLLTIRLFAEELKQRRKSIRLSQKGAAQSLRAFTNGAQPCTDAIIYHFENLQLEPERAMQLIPLLKDWLDWAEKHRLNGKSLPMMGAVTKVPRERKRKVVLFNEKAKHYLEDAFAKNNHPDRYQLDVISEELNIPTRSIRKWFTNRRQRKRFAEKFQAAGNTSSD